MSLELQHTPFAPLPDVDLPHLLETRAVAVDPALEPAFIAHEDARAARDRLLDGALCVTTGQQPGLFTGPLFTIYKALTTVAFARILESRLGRPVVPVFWVAGDDHDLAEANHVHILTVENAVDRVVLRERAADDALVPLYREPLGAGVDEAIARVRDGSPPTEFQTGTLEWLARHYRPEHDYAAAFAGALAELMASYGLVVFRPSHAAAKRAMAPLLVRALEGAETLDRALVAEAERMSGAGVAVPVPVGDGATLVMCECELGRDRLVVRDGRFRARRSGNAWSVDQLRAVAEDDPQRLSPNVLLRPAVEAALLPTLAYVAGPGELAYFPQCAPVYEHLGVAPQAVVPRWSGRIIESRVAKVLGKFGISAEDLDRPAGQLEAQLVREDMPPSAQEAIVALRAALDEEYGRLEGAAADIDPTLKKTVQGAKGSAFKELAHLEKRILSHLKKENEIVVQQLAKARANLFPLGKPQERAFNVVPYLIRYGRVLLDQALDRAAEWYRPLG